MSNRQTDKREPRLGVTRPRSPSEVLEPARAPARPAGVKDRSQPSSVGSAVRVLSGLLTVLLIVMAALGGSGLLLYHYFERPGPLAVSRTIAIPRGEGTIEIAERLEREGVISNRWAFVASHMLQNRLSAEKARELKAGEYEFKRAASMRDVIDTIAQGKAVLAKISIPEGLTSLQIVERLRADENLVGDIAAVPAEGTLLPDTYRFSKGMERQELLDRMKVEQQRLLARAWEKRAADLPVKSPDEAVTLASVIEKETGRADERERVAGVFVNRLRKRMRLQSDPTIIYGIAPGQGSLGRPILRSDIDQKTPYNTYHIDGLPPTPICNPGRPAIEAALNPAKTNDLYFVADGEGGHTFSETLKAHNTAVSTWRKIEKDMREKEQAEAAETKEAGTAAIPIAGSQDASAGAEPAAQSATPEPTAPSPPGTVATVASAKAANVIPLPTRKPKR